MVGRRFLSIVGLGVRRVLGRARIAHQRVAVSVLGVALAVGLMVAVTGIALGLASQTVVQSEGVDYWVVPEDATVQSIAVSTGGVQLGDVHATAARLSADERVDYATPVLLELVPLRHAATGERVYVLAAGIVPRGGGDVLGLSVDALTPGDPHYADGAYNGTWTGEVVLNDAASALTNASTGDSVAIDRAGWNRSLRVVNVTAGEAGTPIGTIPVAVVHLSELQSLTGATAGDQADQILVSTTDPAVRESIEALYPRTSVVTRSGLNTQQLSSSELPLAVAVAALVAAVVVGVLFLTTLMGLEVSADRQQLATLAVIGFSGRSRSLLVAVETVVVSVLGGVVGLGIGVVGIVGVNEFGQAVLGVGTVAVVDPRIAAYALAVSVVIGLVGGIYPVLLSRRAGLQEVLAG